ncbi:hypothetical protein V6N13_004261 [Hibiscus sabdariffa]
MNLTVVVIFVFIASPPVDIANAGATVRTKGQELTGVWSWLTYKVANIELDGVHWIMDSWDKLFSTNGVSRLTLIAQLAWVFSTFVV